MLERMTDLEAELAQLSPEHRKEAERLLALHARAAVIAERLGVDPSDVFHQLQQVARTPEQRLKMGLAHGRRRLRPTPG
jgi:hypothetical protein